MGELPMGRLPVTSVEVTLESGEVLHFIKNEGDTVVMNKVVTQPTGTPASHPVMVTYYTLSLQHVKDVAGVHSEGV